MIALEEGTYQMGVKAQSYKKSEDMPGSIITHIPSVLLAGFGACCIGLASQAEFMYIDESTGKEIYLNTSTGKYYIPDEECPGEYQEISIHPDHVKRIPLNELAEKYDDLAAIGWTTFGLGMSGACASELLLANRK
jgi:hypothetical protein